MINFETLRVIGADGREIPFSCECEKNVSEKITVTVNEDCCVREIVLFDGEHGFPADTPFYGDGYQKLAQYGRTVKEPVLIAGYSDRDHYKMPQTEGMFTVYNYATFDDNGKTTLVGATSGNRFRTEIRVSEKNLQIVQCIENLKFSSGDKIELEKMIILSGDDKNALINTFADEIEKNHPKLPVHEFPIGWCSWYCVGPNISERKIFKALKVIKSKLPEMKFIQIDDGFQPFMGDWLEVSRKFKRSMKEICLDIKKEGFEPAIWLAPFIASKKSRLLREHPEYFIKDEDGEPLCTDKVTFPGWRDAPWYMLDGTNPAAREYIYNVVKTIHDEWGVRYYKLDANNWGALPFGKKYDETKTSVEAYRLMMDVINEASNHDSFVLGCNAPMWPSLGVVNGMRITNDTNRSIEAISSVARECFRRNWMNEKLWLNDPDCLLMVNAKVNVVNPAGNKDKLRKKLEMFKFNTVYIRASGGSILSGDPIKAYKDEQKKLFRKLITLPKIAAEFDRNFEIGTIKYDNVTEYCIFNFSDGEKKFTIDVPENADVINMYTDEVLYPSDGKLTVALNGKSAEWIAVTTKN